MRSRLTYANVMSTLAVFIALGGSSYAAVQLNGRDIQNGSIPAKKVKPNSLTTRQIRERGLRRVPEARVADRLRGGFEAADLLQRCPAGTFATADVCVETVARPSAPYGSAVLECGTFNRPPGAGRRLPTHQELRLALAGVTLAPGGELTSEVVPSATRPGRLDVLYVTDQVGSVAVTTDVNGGEKAFRCVADPHDG